MDGASDNTAAAAASMTDDSDTLWPGLLSRDKHPAHTSHTKSLIQLLWDPINNLFRARTVHIRCEYLLTFHFIYPPTPPSVIPPLLQFV
ncbi:hypothetical protein ACOMHN_014640 [Nucella lapillus]